MSVFNTTDILRFAQQGEMHFAQEYKCIIDRVALSIVSGTSVYSLDDSTIDIRRVTWKGWKLDPMPQRELRRIRLSGTQPGRPYYYIYNNISALTIQLFPVPQETIASTSSNLYGSEIANRCIVEFFRAPNYTSMIIPPFIKRRLIKNYVLKMCFAMEGKGQNLKASKYFTQKWEVLKESYGNILEDLINSPRQLVVVNQPNRFYRRLAKPILPIDQFGISVDDFEY